VERIRYNTPTSPPQGARWGRAACAWQYLSLDAQCQAV